MRKNIISIGIVSIVFLICVIIFYPITKSADAGFIKLAGTGNKGTVLTSQDKIRTYEISEDGKNLGNTDDRDSIAKEERQNNKATQDIAAINDSEILTENAALKATDISETEEISYNEETVSFKIEYEVTKEEYLEALYELEEYYVQRWETAKEYSAKAQKEMISQEYKKWDDELNKIYQMIKRDFPEEVFLLIRDEEREWIKQRDEKALNVSSKFSEVNIADIEYLDMMTRITKQRTYELVDIYYK